MSSVAYPVGTYSPLGDSSNTSSGGTYGTIAEGFPDDFPEAFTASVTGSVTLTYQWTHGAGQNDTNDPAPQCVLATETATASCDPAADFPESATGTTATTGITGETFTSTTIGGVTAQGTRYEVLGVTGGATVTVTSPSMTATACNDGSSWNLDALTASASFGASLANIEITFSTPVIGYPGSYECLVGQQVTAQLSITPDSGCTWSEQNCNPFDSYVADISEGYLIGIDPSANTTISNTLHFGTPGSANYTCSGTVDGQSFSVTQSVLVKKPDWTFTSLIGTVGTTPGSGILKLFPQTGQSYGIAFAGSVTMQSEFAGEGSGSFAYTQLTTPNRTETGPSGTQHWSKNGSLVLDTQATFGGGPADGTIYTIGDTPSEPLNDLTHWTSLTVNEPFVTYMMFTPPGSYSQPVPLSSLTWSWAGTLYYSTLIAPGFYVSDTSTSNTNGSSTSTFPTWSDNVAAGNWVSP